MHEKDAINHSYILLLQNSPHCPDWLQDIVLCNCALVENHHLEEDYDLEDLPQGLASFVFTHTFCGNYIFLYPYTRNTYDCTPLLIFPSTDLN